MKPAGTRYNVNLQQHMPNNKFKRC